MQPALTLYHFPGACSRVTVCALGMAGLDYELKLINLAKEEQTGEAYKAISPLGKVPLMLVDGVPLAENAALLTFIGALRPESGVFPGGHEPLARAEAIGGLSFCGGTLHPQIRGMANPQRVTVGDGEPVRAKSRGLLMKSFGYAESRLAERGWWLGERSIVDVYLDWAFDVARRSGFDTSPFPQLDALRTRLVELPAYVRMTEIDAQSRVTLGL
ncbi:glutathione S-transferase family protein [Sphingomonas sp.]|uniref:glutathione S-transferase family protein n=1 Tax=Sphingomonas sp. TaxID=28214 RepID=UPI0025F6E6E4|nr:glutathione S-transferase family protein [Sphingomonas sp.]